MLNFAVAFVLSCCWTILHPRYSYLFTIVVDFCSWF